MRKFVLLAFCLPLFLSSFSQINENKVKYVYSFCANEAKEELFELLKDDKKYKILNIILDNKKIFLFNMIGKGNAFLIDLTDQK
jgi:hypothetical protein